MKYRALLKPEIHFTFPFPLIFNIITFKAYEPPALPDECFSLLSDELLLKPCCKHIDAAQY